MINIKYLFLLVVGKLIYTDFVYIFLSYFILKNHFVKRTKNLATFFLSNFIDKKEHIFVKSIIYLS